MTIMAVPADDPRLTALADNPEGYFHAAEQRTHERAMSEVDRKISRHWRISYTLLTASKAAGER